MMRGVCSAWDSLSEAVQRGDQRHTTASQQGECGITADLVAQVVANYTTARQLGRRDEARQWLSLGSLLKLGQSELRAAGAAPPGRPTGHPSPFWAATDPLIRLWGQRCV